MKIINQYVTLFTTTSGNIHAQRKVCRREVLAYISPPVISSSLQLLFITLKNHAKYFAHLHHSTNSPATSPFLKQDHLTQQLSIHYPNLNIHAK